MTAEGHTLRELSWMADGKLELLGGTLGASLLSGNGTGEVVHPYDPEVLKGNRKLS